MVGLVDFMRGTVKDVVELFTTKTIKFESVQIVYNDVTGASSETVVTRDILVSPPVAWTEQELREESLRKTDLKFLVPSKTIDDAGISLKPGSDLAVYGTLDGVRYKVIPVKIVKSGDLEALLIIGMRK